MNVYSKDDIYICNHKCYNNDFIYVLDGYLHRNIYVVVNDKEVILLH